MIAFTNWLEEALSALSATDFFYSERLSAFNKLNQHTFLPSQKENYRNLRETLSLLTHQPYHLHRSTPPLLPEAMSGYVHDGQAVVLTFVNGIWSPSALHHTHKGIEMQRLTDCSFFEQEKVLGSYRADMGSSNDIFVLLNKMLAHETYLLKVTGDEQKVIIMKHLVTDAAAHVVPQLMLQVGKGSQVTIVEEWHGLQRKGQPFVNNLTHILLEERAHLSYHSLYTDGLPSVHTLYCNQKDHSTFIHHSFFFSTAMLHLTAQIDGSHARAGLYGLATLSQKEKASQQIQVMHSAPHSLSKQHYKSILAGQAIGSFSGKIYLNPAAQQTNAYQTSNALILSDAAHHYAKPQLEIYADDVKCSHGATTGQLDEAQIFYLQTRGIAAPLAKRLLLEAFGSKIIDAVSLPALQGYLYDKLIAKLVKL